MKKKLKTLSAACALILIILQLVACSNYYYSQKLIEAIRIEDVNAVRDLLDGPHLSVNSPDNPPIVKFIELYTNIPLEEACRTGNFEIISMLIEAGADPNTVGSYLYTPLMSALNLRGENRFEIVKYLIEHGADINYRTNNILRYATHVGYDEIEIIEYLEERGALVGGDLLGEACDWHNSELIRYFVLDRKLDVNYQDEIKQTPLIQLVQVRGGDGMQMENDLNFLLSHGADKTLVDNSGKTAYDYAKENYPEFAELLKP
jgi:ankyrin repeat protein